ncbi:hypothetical protein Mgra_00000534 [Meloidogyne graminicola]|uniref:RING-type domain-containing protein n=1 Tax=Meloidogyne graminicola TaxID=189291 RepID=A0A8T0A448_9BILA|nr:hypothetical protein Mgra_00000534 [Meloidogyne graminicola]
MFNNFSIYYYILIYLLSNSTISISKEQKVECIADYLLLSKNIQTEIFVEEGLWSVKRGIQIDLIKDFEITKKEMSEFMNVIYANTCFGNNYNLIKTENISKLTTDSDNVDISNNVLIFKNVKEIIGRDHLILSKNVQERLESQSFCLANFLFKLFGENSLEAIKVINQQNTNEIIAILEKYKFNGNYVFRWKPQNLLSIVNNKNINSILEGIKECSEILNTHISYGINLNQKRIINSLSNFDELLKIYQHFNPEQIFFDRIPNHFVNENKSINHKCCICLSNLKFGEKMTTLVQCKHIFHYECIEPWLRTKNNCPICRATAFPEINIIQHNQPQQNIEIQQQQQPINIEIQNNQRPNFRNIMQNVMRCFRH